MKGSFRLEGLGCLGPVFYRWFWDAMNSKKKCLGGFGLGELRAMKIPEEEEPRFKV